MIEQVEWQHWLLVLCILCGIGNAAWRSYKYWEDDELDMCLNCILGLAIPPVAPFMGLVWLIKRIRK